MVFPLPQVPLKEVVAQGSLDDGICKKIAGRKRPALVDPTHKVRQGGKGSVWDGQTYDRWTLLVHFRPTSSPLPVHFRSIWAP